MLLHSLWCPCVSVAFIRVPWCSFSVCSLSFSDLQLFGCGVTVFRRDLNDMLDSACVCCLFVAARVLLFSCLKSALAESLVIELPYYVCVVFSSVW